MSNKVQNEEKKISDTKCFNDQDILNDLLESEKNISNNISVALNEMSNELLYDELFRIFQDVKDTARILFDFAFKNGWYALEQAENNKVNQEIDKLNNKLNDLK